MYFEFRDSSEECSKEVVKKYTKTLKQLDQLKTYIAIHSVCRKIN